MIVTEEEAKGMWCPEARIGGPMNTEAEGTSYNRWPQSPSPDAQCIGSACMAWRWRTVPDLRRVDRTLGDDYSYGYCGKAGKP